MYHSSLYYSLLSLGPSFIFIHTLSLVQVAVTVEGQVTTQGSE